MLLVTQCGEQNDRDVAGFHLTFYYLTHLLAIHYRHHDVGKNQVGLAFIDEVERFLSVAYTFHLVGVRQAVDNE